MLGFVAPRLVLLAVPKTGTTALQEALARHAQMILRARPEIKHVTMRQYQRHLEPVLSNIPGRRFEVIAVIREPVSWLGSWFRYRQRESFVGSERSTAGLSFEGFVQDYLIEGDDRPPYARLGSPAGFLSPQPGKPGPDHLFQYEQMDLLVAFLERALKTDISVPRTNVSPDADLTLSPETRARLDLRMAADRAMWSGALRDAQGRLVNPPAPPEPSPKDPAADAAADAKVGGAAPI